VYTIEVYDAAGRIVADETLTLSSALVQTINLDATAKGIYFVTISDSSNVVTKKIIVE
jgi:Secretion system C-terminal sorting domain